MWADLQESYNQDKLSEEEIRFLLKMKMQLINSLQKDLGVWFNRAEEAEGGRNIDHNMAICEKLCYANKV